MHALIRIPFWLTKMVVSQKKKENWMIVKTYASGVVKPFKGWRGLAYKKQ